MSPYRENEPMPPPEPYAGLLAHLRTMRGYRSSAPLPPSSPHWAASPTEAPLPPWIVGLVVVVCGGPVVMAIGHVLGRL